jgi:predicted DNA-binding ribbon-helix-helix protein
MNLVKRSLNLGGHPTSVALEPEFWAALVSFARDGRQSLAGLIAQIDESRGTTPLASALRVYALSRAFGASRPEGGHL